MVGEALVAEGGRVEQGSVGCCLQQTSPCQAMGAWAGVQSCSLGGCWRFAACRRGGQMQLCRGCGVVLAVMLLAVVPPALPQPPVRWGAAGSARPLPSVAALSCCSSASGAFWSPFPAACTAVRLPCLVLMSMMARSAFGAYQCC